MLKLSPKQLDVLERVFERGPATASVIECSPEVLAKLVGIGVVASKSFRRTTYEVTSLGIRHLVRSGRRSIVAKMSS